MSYLFIIFIFTTSPYLQATSARLFLSRHMHQHCGRGVCRLRSSSILCPSLTDGSDEGSDLVTLNCGNKTTNRCVQLSSKYIKCIIDFYRLPQGKSRLGRDQLTMSGDSFAALHVLLLFMLCYAML